MTRCHSPHFGCVFVYFKCVLEANYYSIFGSGFGFGSALFLVPVSAQFLNKNFGSVPVSVDISVPVDH